MGNRQDERKKPKADGKAMYPKVWNWRAKHNECEFLTRRLDVTISEILSALSEITPSSSDMMLSSTTMWLQNLFNLWDGMRFMDALHGCASWLAKLRQFVFVGAITAICWRIRLYFCAGTSLWALVVNWQNDGVQKVARTIILPR